MDHQAASHGAITEEIIREQRQIRRLERSTCQEEFHALRLLQASLNLRRYYAICDQTSKPTYPAYVAGKQRNRVRIRRLIKDLRWMSGLRRLDTTA